MKISAGRYLNSTQIRFVVCVNKKGCTTLVPTDWQHLTVDAPEAEGLCALRT